MMVALMVVPLRRPPHTMPTSPLPVKNNSPWTTYNT